MRLSRQHCTITPERPYIGRTTLARFPQSTKRFACFAADTTNQPVLANFPSNLTAPSLPPSVRDSLSASRVTWLQRCLNSPLVDPVTNSRVHIYGTVHFAPYGGPSGLQDLQQLINRVQPSVLAIEQPFDLAARAGLPYPEVLQHLAALSPATTELLAGPTGHSSNAFNSTSPLLDPHGQHGAFHSDPTAWAVEVQRLREALPGLAQPARVGRDLLDPTEVFGFYGGCDYVTRPGQLVEAAELFGHLPGLEYAAIAAAAEQLGVQVYSVDAPLRLQETWVAQLVAGFTLGEADLRRRLQRDVAAAAALLPPDYYDWDAALAEAVRQRELGCKPEGPAAAGGAGLGAGQLRPEEPSTAAVTAFKVSRAVAAATLPYDQVHRAVMLQARLQPLKFALFARRARHLVLQVRDLCQRMTVQQVRMDATALRVSGAAAGSGPSQSGSPAGGVQGLGQAQAMGYGSTAEGGGGRLDGRQSGKAYFDVGAQPEKVVLAVVGRQYVPYMEELWSNERSVLWHGDVPRTFTASQLEPPRGQL